MAESAFNVNNDIHFFKRLGEPRQYAKWLTCKDDGAGATLKLSEFKLEFGGDWNSFD